MKENLLRIICCPECHGPFSLLNTLVKDTEVVSGSLTCPKCDSSYPIIDGLPIILKDVGRMNRTQKVFGKQWTLQNTGYFEKDTIYGKSEEEGLQNFQVAFDLSDLSNLSGKFILDAGCGCGRLTESIGKAVKNTTIVGFDISEGARVAYNRCKQLQNVHIIQCDLLHPPFHLHSFDYIWCEGVIHHTPNSLQSFKKLDSLLTKNGKLYIWVYPNEKFNHYRFIRDILWKPYLLPFPCIYFFAWLFAVPLYLLLILIKGVKKQHKLKTLVFEFYDNFAPEFQHHHSKEEVRNWFVSHKYGELKFIGNIAAVGKKQVNG